MTVKEMMEELSYHDEDEEIIFEIDDEFEPDSITEDRWGNKTVRVRSKIQPTFSGTIRGNCYFEFGLIEEK